MRLGKRLQTKHEHFMQQALAEAQKAMQLGEVPVGAVAVVGEEVIARAHNLREQLADPTAHAEMLAIQKAAGHCGGWRLPEVTLYVTLEPCPMCAGAILQARVGHLVFGAYDEKFGAVGSVVDLLRDGWWQSSTQVVGGILADECQKILRQFFVERRKK